MHVINTISSFKFFDARVNVLPDTRLSQCQKQRRRRFEFSMQWQRIPAQLSVFGTFQIIDKRNDSGILLLSVVIAWNQSTDNIQCK